MSIRLDDGTFRLPGTTRIARQGVRVGFRCSSAGNAFAYGNHRAPLGKARAIWDISQPVAQAVQTSVIFSPG